MKKHPNLNLRNGIWHYDKMIRGHRYRGSTGQRTLSAARTFLEDYAARVREKRLSPHLRKTPALSEFAGSFLLHIQQRFDAGDLRRSTQRTYQNGCRLLSATSIWSMRISEISRKTARVLQFPGSPSNANQALRTLSAILGYACEEGLLTAAPKIALRKERNRIVVVQPWLESLLLESAPLNLRAFVTIMLDCGMRPDEVCRMRWQNVLWQESAIYIPDGKTANARRHVGMTDRMRQALRDVQRQHELRGLRNPKYRSMPWVFPARVGNRHAGNPSGAWLDLLASVEGVAKARNLPALPDDLVLYSCRHTFATNYLSASGGDVGKLMVLMGHADIQTTQKYLHPSTAGAGKTMDQHNANVVEIGRKRA